MSWFNYVGDDLELRVHVQPGARRTEVCGLHGDSLKIRVRAPPVGGAANDALLEFLADELQTPRRRCELVSGDRSRHKRVRIAAPDRAWAEAKLRAWQAQAMSS